MASRRRSADTTWLQKTQEKIRLSAARRLWPIRTLIRFAAAISTKNALRKASYRCGESFHRVRLPRCNMIFLVDEIAPCFYWAREL